MGKEKPIIFSTEAVMAILDGRKTATRRPIKIELGLADTDKNDPSYLKIPDAYGDYWDAKDLCRYQPGDILWVRETWAWLPHWNCESQEAGYCSGCTQAYKDELGCFRYKATDGNKWTEGWRPSIHMPKIAARLFLEVTGVRVERVQDITEADAIAEGCGGECDCNRILCETCHNTGWADPPVLDFMQVWDKLNAKRGYGWDANPYVWVCEFRRIDNYA